MPKIPIAPQNQIIAASNPVPISGTGEARLPGEQVATFGKGLMDLAGARNSADTLLAKVQMEEADAKFDSTTRDAIAKVSAQVNENPGLNGMEARNQFVNDLKDQMNSQAGGIENPLYKRLWQAKAAQKLQAFGEDVAQVQLKSQVKHVGQMNDSLISTYADQAANDPSRRDEAIIKSREAIDSVGDQIYTPIMKQQLRDGLNRRIDTAIFEKMIAVNDNNTADSFEKARKFVDAHPDSFTIEGIDKIHDKIDKAEYAYLSHDRAQVKFDNYQMEQKRKEVRLVNDATYSNMIFNPNTDPSQKRELLSKARELRTLGLMSPAVFATLENPGKNGSQDTSYKTSFDIYSKALNGMSFKDAEALVQTAVAKDGFEPGSMLAKDANSLLGRLHALERSPEKKQAEIDGERLVRAAWSKDMLESSLYGPENKTQMENAVIQYHRLIQNGADPRTAAVKVRTDFSKSALVGIDKGVPVNIALDKDSIQKELAAFAPAYEKALKDGNTELANQIKNRKNLLLPQLKVLIENENLQKTIQAPKEEKKNQGPLDSIGDKLKGWFSGGASQ